VDMSTPLFPELSSALPLPRNDPYRVGRGRYAPLILARGVARMDVPTPLLSDVIPSSMRIRRVYTGEGCGEELGSLTFGA